MDLNELTAYLASEVDKIKTVKQMQRGLSERDHDMFNRALKGYAKTEVELADFRRKHPYGTNDPRVREDWKPNNNNQIPSSPTKIRRNPIKDMEPLLSGEVMEIFSRLNNADIP